MEKHAFPYGVVKTLYTVAIMTLQSGLNDSRG